MIANNKNIAEIPTNASDTQMELSRLKIDLDEKCQVIKELQEVQTVMRKTIDEKNEAISDLEKRADNFNGHGTAESLRAESDIKVLMSKYEHEVLASTDLERRLNDQILLTTKTEVASNLKDQLIEAKQEIIQDLKSNQVLSNDDMGSATEETLQMELLCHVSS